MPKLKIPELSPDELLQLSDWENKILRILRGLENENI